jgi:hypothetical protein
VCQTGGDVGTGYEGHGQTRIDCRGAECPKAGNAERPRAHKVEG